MKWFNDMKIRNKHLFIFGLLLLVMVSFAAFSVAQIINIVNNNKELVGSYNARQALVAEAINDIHVLRLANISRGYIFEDDSFMNVISRNIKASEQSAKSFTANMKEFRGIEEGDPRFSDKEKEQRQAMANGIDNAFSRYMALTDKLIAATERNDKEEVTALLEESIPLGNDLIDKLQDVSDLVFYTSVKKSVEASDNTTRIIKLIIYMSGGFVLLLVFSLILIVRSIYQPISRMEKAVSEIANGNLSYPIRGDRNDELGMLSASISNMVSKLSNHQEIEKQNTRLKQLTETLEHHDNLLNSVNKTAGILLAAEEETIELSLNRAMEMMGKSVNADRVNIMRNEIIDGELCFSYKYEWVSVTDNQSAGINKSAKVPYSFDPEWRKRLTRGECVNGPVRDLSEKTRNFFSETRIKSVLVIPLYIENNFWGLVSFSDCVNERVFTDDEVNILHSGALMMASAINRGEDNAEINEIMGEMTSLKERLWEKVENGLIIVDVETREIMDVNPAACQMYGGERSEIVGEICHKLFGQHECPILDEGKSMDREERRLQRADGTKIPVQKSIVRIQYNGKPAFLESFTDISYIKAAEEQKRMLEVAEQASYAKSEFLANISHEMRTPLTAVLGLSGLTMEIEGLSEEAVTNLEKIYSSGSTLLNIVNDILDISKIEARKLELLPNEYDIPSLINDVITQNILRVGSKLITFSLDISEDVPASLYGDDLRIKQILNNLLSNAFKYTNEGSVELGARCERADDDDMVWMKIWVKDTGVGIRPEDIDKLFLDYSQVDTRANRQIEGTGLGLAITKKLVDLMEGTINVESVYGKGSVFTIRFKQKVINGAGIGATVVENLKSFRYTNAKRKQNAKIKRIKMPYARVLVVDDNITNLDVAKGLMKPYGMQIDCVTSGRQAINAIAAAEGKYSLIFMDHMMPEMDGFEATSRIREIGTDYAKNIPIIALTANAIAGNDIKFLNNGFQGFLSKPIDLSRLDDALRRWARDKSKEDQNYGIEEETKEEAKKEAKQETKEKTRSANYSFDIGGLEFNKGVERFGGDAEAFLNILRSYAVNTRPLLKLISEIKEDHLVDYAINVHSIKGSSRGIFADAVADLAEELEGASKSGDIDFLIKNNARLIELTENLIVEIEKAMTEIAKDEKLDKKARFKRIQLPYARVLVVDDNQTNLDIARGLMKPYGMRIDCVTSGREAVNIARTESFRGEKALYDAIFMDHMMPEMDGTEALELIRKIDTSYALNVPVIALTANDLPGNEEMFLSKGFQDYLSKPIDLARLDEVIRRWISVNSLKRSEE